MINDGDVFDVGYTNVPEDEECVINAVQIGKKIGETPSTIRTWASLYEKYLYIKKINGRFTYTEASVEQFRFIKELIRDKSFTHRQIEDIIKKQGFEYAKYDGGLIDLKDPLGFQALSSAIALETNKQLQDFLVKFTEYQAQQNEKLKEDIIQEVSMTVDDVVSDKLVSQKEEIINSIRVNDNVTEDVKSKVDTLIALMNGDKEDKIGFFGRLRRKIEERKYKY